MDGIFRVNAEMGMKMIKIRKGDFVKECYLTVNGVRILSASIPQLNPKVLKLISKDVNVIFPNGELVFNMVHYTNVILTEICFTGCTHIDTKLYEVFDGERRYEISIEFEHKGSIKSHNQLWEYYE